MQNNTLSFRGFGSILLVCSALPAIQVGAADISELPRSATRESHAQAPVSTSPEEQETRLTKNWGGARSVFSENGLDLGIIYKGQLDSLRSGGLEPGNVFHSNLDLRLSVDLEKMAAWRGGSLFFYGLFNHGGETSARVGDEQVTTNIESPREIIKLYEAWIQQTVLDSKLSILAGLHDLNSEFYVTDTATLFFNSSFGVGRELSQTGAMGPSIFPTTAASLRIRTEPSERVYFQLGLFNSVASHIDRSAQFRFKGSDGTLIVSELAYWSAAPLPFKYAAGFWGYTTPADHVLSSIDTSLPKSANQGVYFLADHGLTERLSAFARYGIASTEVNPIASNFAAGLVYTGLIPTRGRDKFGIALTQVRSGSEYQLLRETTGSPVLSSETVLELNYRIEVIPGIALQPDFQWVKNPSADSTIPNAKILSGRVEISL